MMNQQYPNSWEDDAECSELPSSMWSAVLGIICTLAVFSFLMVRTWLTSRRPVSAEREHTALDLTVRHSS